MATWQDLDEEQENVESQGEEGIISNLYFMADIISEKETEVSDFDLELHKIFKNHMVISWMTFNYLLPIMLL